MFISSKQSKKGFTLIEIILVMVMIAVLTMLASSKMFRSLDKAKIKAAGKDLVSALRYTRGQAVIKHEDKTIKFNVDKKTYQAPKKKVVKIPDEIDMFVYTADSEIADDSVGSIRFFSDGSSTGGYVKLVYGKRIQKINVNWLTGEIRMVEGTGS
ncbi:MAG TPA: prepilin-type N-terminal cleavage/methylation domain-containing protein [Oceanospirillales bacterium]|nr:prepilin-type N-terminal cleavage/methylation domain-containing protein [Oceanospirillales bacterium]